MSKDKSKRKDISRRKDKQKEECFFRVRGIESGQKKTVPNETKVERFGADFNFLYIKDYFCFQSGGTIEGQVLF